MLHLATTVGKSARGKASPANPTLVLQDPVSKTTPISCPDILVLGLLDIAMIILYLSGFVGSCRLQYIKPAGSTRQSTVSGLTRHLVKSGGAGGAPPGHFILSGTCRIDTYTYIRFL